MQTSQEADERTIFSTHRSASARSGTSVDNSDIGHEKDIETAKAGLGKVEDGGKDLTQPASLEFPEGGLQAWATVAGAFCIQFCGFGYTTAFGVYQDFYVREYITNQTASTISWIGSVNAFLVIGGGLFAGLLYDRGYFKLAIYSGSLLLSLGLFMLSLAQPDQFYQVFLSQGVCAGLGAGMLYVPSYAVVGHYFLKRRTLAMSIVASGSSLGAAIHPIMLNNLFDSIGFGDAVRASAGLVSGMLLCACLLMRTRLPPPDKTIPLIPAIRKFSKDWAYICAVAGLTIFTIGFYFPLYYLQLDASSHNLDPTFSFYSLVILNFCSFVGRLASGFAAQAFGVANMITFTTCCCAVIMLCMIPIKSVVSVILIGIFLGFFLGAYIALNAPLFAVLTDDFSEIGARMGVAFTFSAVGGLVGSPISGALLGNEPYAWWKAGLFSGLVAFGGFGCFLAMTLILRRRQEHHRIQ